MKTSCVSYRVIPCRVPHRPPCWRVIACHTVSGILEPFGSVFGLKTWPGIPWKLVCNWFTNGFLGSIRTVEKGMHDPEGYIALLFSLRLLCI